MKPLPVCLLLLAALCPGGAGALAAEPPPAFAESPLEPPALKLRLSSLPAPAPCLPAEMHGPAVKPQTQAAAQALVAARTQELGAEARETLHARRLLAKTTAALSHEAVAAAQLQELLPVMTRVFGAEQRETLACQTDLVAALVAIGRYTQAEKQSRSLITTATRVLGAEDRLTLKAHRVLARALIEQRKIAEAVNEARLAYDTSRRVLGPEDRGTLQAAVVLLLATTFEPAAITDTTPQPEQLLPLLQRVLGAEHRATLACQAEASLHACGDSGPTAETEEQLRCALSAQTRVLGADDLDTLRTHLYLAATLDELEESPQAEAEIRQMLGACERALAPEDAAALLSGQTCLTKILLREEKYPEAEEAARKWIATATRVLGPEDIETVRARLRLAGILEKLDRYPAAAQERRAALTILEHTQGPEAAETLLACHNLAYCLWEQKKPRQALPCARRALAGRLKTLGPEATETDNTQRLVNMLTYLVDPHSLLTGTGGESGGGSASAKNTTHDHPVVMVNGGIIMDSDVQEQLKTREQALPSAHPSEPKAAEKQIARARLEALDQLIDRQLLLSEFINVGGVLKQEFVDEDISTTIQDSFHGSREAFLAGLAKNGLSYAEYHHRRARLIMELVMRQRLAGKVSPDETDVREYFDQNKHRWTDPGRVKMHTLTIAKYTGESGPDHTPEAMRHLAGSLREKIAHGADMAALARTHSQDSHADEGGDWGWMQLSDLTQDLCTALAGMKPGGLSPVIELESSFIILRVDDRQPGTPPAFDHYQKEAKQLLEQELKDKRVKERLQILRSRSQIQFLEPV